MVKVILLRKSATIIKLVFAVLLRLTLQIVCILFFQVYKTFFADTGNDDAFWALSEVADVIAEVKNCRISTQDGAFKLGVSVRQVMDSFY